jgi:prevent-host-death family protein
MEEIAISEFKAKCLALMERVRKTRKPLRVVKHGKPVVEIIPATNAPTRAELFGSMKGTFEITGDVVSPSTDADEWEVLRD